MFFGTTQNKIIKCAFGTSAIAFVLLLVELPTLAASASQIVWIDRLDVSNNQMLAIVPSGHGLVIDLSKTGQVIEAAAFGDPTKFSASGLNGELCYLQQECKGRSPSILLLRNLKGISLPNQSNSPDGSTTLTLITVGKLGQKTLQLKVKPAENAAYTALVVESEEDTALAPIPINIKRLQDRESSFSIEDDRAEPLLQKQAEISTTDLSSATEVQEIGLQPNPPDLVTTKSEEPVTSSQPLEVRSDERSELNMESSSVNAKFFGDRDLEALQPSLQSNSKANLSNQQSILHLNDASNLKFSPSKEAKSHRQSFIHRLLGESGRKNASISKASRTQRNAVMMGLLIAVSRGIELNGKVIKIEPYSELYNTVQTAAANLTINKSITESAKLARIDPSLLQALIEAGSVTTRS
ncbi:hypothetical protein C7B80_25090 [Cyanosarcina cf. burmensis CCALA 770]|nr:hypothetical protein C7B80_25090 [Cyanosarcina cf. burmensis CCALA 770]